jgi:hypothetical protein
MSDLEIRVYGSDTTGDRVREVGSAFSELYDAVARSMGAEGVGLQVTGEVIWCCDGCEARVEAERKPHDWLNAGGNDYCSRCQRERGAP